MRFVFDTSVLIDYLRGDPLADDALFTAAGKGEVFISGISLMELTIFDEVRKAHRKSNQRIIEELDKIERLCQRLGIKKISLSTRAQEHAFAILRAPRYRSLLGKNALTDSLIIGTGIVKRAYSVTGEKTAWFEIARQYPRGVQVLSPGKLVAEL